MRLINLTPNGRYLQGIISEAKVDSFNLPMYSATLEEMKELIQRNGSFNVEKMELTMANGESNHQSYSSYSGRILQMHLRAGIEEIISQHFGTEIIDDLFDRYAMKAEDFSHRLQSSERKGALLFVVLKRK
jgi:indole-3-acetate O-methyltransferase